MEAGVECGGGASERVSGSLVSYCSANTEAQRLHSKRDFEQRCGDEAKRRRVDHASREEKTPILNPRPLYTQNIRATCNKSNSFAGGRSGNLFVSHHEKPCWRREMLLNRIRLGSNTASLRTTTCSPSCKACAIPTDLNPVSDGDGLVLRRSRIRSSDAETISPSSWSTLLFVRATGFRRQDQVRRVGETRLCLRAVSA